MGASRLQSAERVTWESTARHRRDRRPAVVCLSLLFERPISRTRLATGGEGHAERAPTRTLAQRVRHIFMPRATALDGDGSSPRGHPRATRHRHAQPPDRTPRMGHHGKPHPSPRHLSSHLGFGLDVSVQEGDRVPAAVEVPAVPAASSAGRLLLDEGRGPRPDNLVLAGVLAQAGAPPLQSRACRALPAGRGLVMGSASDFLVRPRVGCPTLAHPPEGLVDLLWWKPSA